MSRKKLSKNNSLEASNQELAYGSPQGHMNMSPQASLGLYSN